MVGAIIGWLINPAGAPHHLMGVYQPHLVDLVADVVTQLPMKHVIIAHGVDGLDEVSILGPTKIAEVKDGRIDKYEVTPEYFGFSRAKFEDVMGGDPQFNARVIRDIFEGRDDGPRRDFLVLNNGFALYAAGTAADTEPRWFLRRLKRLSHAAVTGVEKPGQRTSQRRHCDRERCSAIGTRSPHSLLHELPPSLRSRLPVFDAARIRFDDCPCATSASNLFRQSAERRSGKLNHARNGLASIRLG